MEVLIIGVIVAAVGFAIYYIVQDAKERGTEWKEKEFSAGGKLLLALNVMLTFAGAGATAYLFLGMDEPTWGVVGLCVWIICSVISAYVTSPLRVFVIPTNAGDGNGCAFMIYMPLMMVVMLVSAVLVMLVAWVYALMAIFRGGKKGIAVVAMVLMAALLATPLIVQRVQYYQAAMEEQRLEQEAAAKKEREDQLSKAIAEKVKADLLVGQFKELELTEEENDFVNSTTLNAFALKEVRKEVSDMLSNLYLHDNVDGILKLTGYLAINSALSNAPYETGVNICFTDSFLKMIWTEVKANGTFVESGMVCDVYQYKEYEVWIDRGEDFVAVYIDRNGARRSVMYSNYYHMKEMIDTYGEDMVDYYLTGYSADLKTVNSSNTSNTGTSTTTKKGNCSRCSGTGKVTKHYGNSWNKKPGYQYGKTCGACNGTGWVK